MKRVPHAECEFPIFGVTLIPTGWQPFTEVSVDPCWRGLEWDSWARIWPPPKGSATAPEVGFGDTFRSRVTRERRPLYQFPRSPFMNSFRTANNSSGVGQGGF